mgnify:CR=1 FL=1
MKKKEWFSTGSDLLDLVVGGGKGSGFPSGKIINIVGDKATAKTWIACEIIASSYYKHKEKLKWVYDDCESGFSFDTKRLYGIEIIPIDESKRYKSNTIQDLFCNIRAFLDSLKKNEIGIYVVDSLDGLSSEEIEELADKRYRAYKQGKKLEKGSYKMETAKFLSQEFFRTLADDFEDKNVLLIIISQIRYNIDVLSFEKYTRAGGKALDFYAYAVLWLAKLSTIDVRGNAIGTVIKAKTTKLKAPKPYRECVLSLLFDYGIDNIGSNIDFLYDLRGKRGDLLKASNNIEYEGKQFDRNSLIEYIEACEERVKELTKKVMEKWEKIEESIVVRRKRKYGMD